MTQQPGVTVTLVVSKGPQGEQFEHGVAIAGNDIVDAVATEVANRLIHQGVKVRTITASVSCSVTLAPSPPPKPFLWAPDEPKRPQRHTCGIDGDPGATAPLNGQCQACIDSVPYEGDTMTFTGQA